MEKVYDALKKIRESQNKTQKEVADFLGIVQNNYGLIERGKVSLTIERAYELAEFFKVDPISILAPEYYDSVKKNGGLGSVEVYKENTLLKYDMQETTKSLCSCWRHLIVCYVIFNRKRIFEHYKELEKNNMIILSMYLDVDMEFVRRILKSPLSQIFEMQRFSEFHRYEAELDSITDEFLGMVTKIHYDENKKEYLVSFAHPYNLIASDLPFVKDGFTLMD
ncbi:MAG: helix-turn-helix transcriptional regulator [Bacteroidota bacterium]|nr:helix-turn-helix transcriptional regulator [Bacteroidota bacterium]